MLMVIDVAIVLMLAQAIDNEARNQPNLGKRAIAEVVLNRVYSPLFPNTIPEVLREDRGPEKFDCQFSYMCDGKFNRISDIPKSTHDMAQEYYVMYISGERQNTYLTEGATHFHANYVAPYWSDIFDKTVSIGDHIFYRETR